VTRIVAIGEELLLEGYALAGVEVLPAGDPENVAAVWESLPDDVGFVLLSEGAHGALGDRLEASDRIWAVVPS
jgi:vacuolar-type H+-ATPase subunit F/Vma7